MLCFSIKISVAVGKKTVDLKSGMDSAAAPDDLGSIFAAVISAALAFLVALQWQEALKMSVEKATAAYGGKLPELASAFISAVAVTLVVTGIMFGIAAMQKKKKPSAPNKKKAEED